MIKKNPMLQELFRILKKKTKKLDGRTNMAATKHAVYRNRYSNAHFKPCHGKTPRKSDALLSRVFKFLKEADLLNQL